MVARREASRARRTAWMMSSSWSRIRRRNSPALEQVDEPLRREHDGDQVGLAGDVHLPQAPGQHLAREDQARLEAGQPPALAQQVGLDAVELALVGVELGLDRGPLALDDRDRPLQARGDRAERLGVGRQLLLGRALALDALLEVVRRTARPKTAAARPTGRAPARPARGRPGGLGCGADVSRSAGRSRVLQGNRPAGHASTQAWPRQAVRATSDVVMTTDRNPVPGPGFLCDDAPPDAFPRPAPPDSRRTGAGPRRRERPAAVRAEHQLPAGWRRRDPARGGGGRGGGGGTRQAAAWPPCPSQRSPTPRWGSRTRASSSPRRRPRSPRSGARMGVDYVRIQAYWNAHLARPRLADHARPASTPPTPMTRGYNWAPLDRAVNAVRNNGMRVMLTLNQVRPRWASTQPSVAVPGWRPSPRASPSSSPRWRAATASAVDRYLSAPSPTSASSWRRSSPARAAAARRVAPHIYRNLLNAAYPGDQGRRPGRPDPDRRAGPDRQPAAAGPPGVKPLLFIQQMACVDAKLPAANPHRRVPRLQGAARRRLRLPPLRQHRRPPRSPPRATSSWPRSATCPACWAGSTASPAKRLRATAAAVFRSYLTEYGYITNPPNRKLRRLAGQAGPATTRSRPTSCGQRRSRIKLLTQYEFSDDPTFPTGLLFRNGKPKPALFQYPTPSASTRAAAGPRPRSGARSGPTPSPA